MEVDIRGGHKTGFYLDQRENRRPCAPNWRAAARAQLLLLHRRLQPAGAGRRRGEVLSIDSSGPALATARRNLALNPQLDAAAPSGATPTYSRSCAR
jgi:23S rRNA (cytosine1962-C5)-methyltransferase